jgi:hypothetical protein
VLVFRVDFDPPDAGREPLDARRLTAPAETGLRLLSLATIVLAATMIAFRI